MGRIRLSPSGKFVSTTTPVQIDLPLIAAGATGEVIVAVPGATVGQAASWGAYLTPLTAGIVPAGAFVSSAGNVTFRAANVSAAPVDAPALNVVLTLTNV